MEGYDQAFQRLWIGREDPVAHDAGIDYLKRVFDIEQHILIREDYKVLWTTILKERADRWNPHVGGLIIWGQPGIGESLGQIIR